MADIFLSYAAEDRDRVRSLVAALEQHGWTVWWDRDIPRGTTWDEVLERFATIRQCCRSAFGTCMRATCLRRESSPTRWWSACVRSLSSPCSVDPDAHDRYLRGLPACVTRPLSPDRELRE